MTQPKSTDDTRPDENTGLTRRKFLEGSTALGIASSTGLGYTPAFAQETSPGVPVDSGICELGAVELSAAIRSRTVSCIEVMQAYLDRIDAINPAYNALVSIQDREDLLEQAAKRDHQLSAGEYLGWMHGFPHAVKDLTPTAGIRTTFGSPIFSEFIPDHDGIFVERIRRAGAIIIGKSNLPEFAFGSQSYNPVFETVRNAYDRSRTAGGSSGGAASALALNLVPVADGSDMMGSLRNPAGFNNVIGFRPSFGRVPSGPTAEPYLQQLGYNGPMGRNVTDTAFLLSTMAGFDARDPLSIDQDPQIFTEPLKREFRGTRIGWLGDFDGYLPMEEGVIDLCRSSLSHFESLGCTIDDAQTGFPMDQLWETWLTHRHGISAVRMAPLYEDKEKRALLKREIIWEIEGGIDIGFAEFEAASKGRYAWYQEILRLFGEYDFLVIPSAQVFPFDASLHWPREIAGTSMDTYHRWMEVVIGGTLSGCPVINVPAGFNEAGLTMGLQIIGPMKQDFAVLQIAHAYEQAARWNLDIHPPLPKA